MASVSDVLPSLKPELLPAVSRCLSNLEKVTIDGNAEAETIFEVFIDVAGIKVKCLVDLSDFFYGAYFA